MLSSSKIRIGITLRVVKANNYDEKRDALNQEWTSFLEKLDAYPVFIPNTLTNVESFLKYMQLDGMILSGGDNIGDNSERDRTEKAIIEYGINSKIPIFGVCRGMQVLNKYFGGSIITKNNSQHVGKPHIVKILHKKFLEYLNNESMNVNSFHNNTLTMTSLGTNLEPFATVPEDQTVEGFFHTEFPIMGVMWHPERDPNSKNQSLLKSLMQKKMFWLK